MMVVVVSGVCEAVAASGSAVAASLGSVALTPSSGMVVSVAGVFVVSGSMGVMDIGSGSS